MKEYVIMTDSCCDLPLEYMEKRKIPYVSLTCSFAGKEYPDDFGKSLSFKTFYDGMRKGEVPKTSQPNSEAFYKVFKENAEKGKDILYIGISTGLSGSCNSANIARDMMSDEYKDTKIIIVDILTASLGQGLMVIKAVEMKENGASIEEVALYLEEVKLHLNTYLTVDDLIHLKRGGRISSAAAMIGILLNIKPILTLNDEGRVIAVAKAKGRKNALAKLAEYVKERIEDPENSIMSICHCDIEAEAHKLKEIIMNMIPIKDIIINYVGPVVGTYGGPGAIAVFFIGKHRQNHIINIDI